MSYLKVIKGIDEENRNPEKNPVLNVRFSGKTWIYGPKNDKTPDIFLSFTVFRAIFSGFTGKPVIKNRIFFPNSGSPHQYL